ncbi:MAG TPA: cupin domain-containing protein [Actinomycetales bacterium]|nr:cupin domain-containing protein [Actinomycetales bacterium]
MEQDRSIIVDSLGSLDLVQSQPAIYDRPIGLRLLHQDPASGAEHYLVRYPAGLKAQRHRHTAAHTIVVLGGRLEANGDVIGPGAYCHFPAGQPMHHAPAGGDSCVFVTVFHGPFDVEPLDIAVRGDAGQG